MKQNIVTIILACLIVLAGCGGKEEDHEQPVEHTPEGGKAITLSREQQMQVEIKTEVVEMKPLSIPLVFPGKVTLNDRSVAHISARVNGRIEKVNAVLNDRVQKGNVLVEVYSQEFLAMQSEFIQAEERLKHTPSRSSDFGTAQAIYKSSRSKLNAVGVSDSDIDRLENEHTTQTYLLVRSPFTGTVLAGNARVGEFVQVGTELYTIADLSTLWVIADIYEKDLHLVRSGMSAAITVTAYPNMKFHGRLTTLYDVVDEKTRTIKARVEVDNPSAVLKPEMFASVDIVSNSDKVKLIIPSGAVLGETERQYVFIAVHDTIFEQRLVRLGIATKDFIEITSGLSQGERIVVTGGFFLKSELGKSALGEE